MTEPVFEYVALLLFESIDVCEGDSVVNDDNVRLALPVARDVEETNDVRDDFGLADIDVHDDADTKDEKEGRALTVADDVCEKIIVPLIVLDVVTVEDIKIEALIVEEVVSVCEFRPVADEDIDTDELLVAETVVETEIIGLTVTTGEALVVSDKVTALELEDDPVAVLLVECDTLLRELADIDCDEIVVAEEVPVVQSDVLEDALNVLLCVTELVKLPIELNDREADVLCVAEAREETDATIGDGDGVFEIKAEEDIVSVDVIDSSVLTDCFGE